MRPITVLLAALLATTASAAEPSLSEASQECIGCHEAAKPGESGVRPDAFLKSIHGDLSCTDCHQGYQPDGPHEVAPPTDPAQAALLARLTAGKGPTGEPRTTSPRAYLGCSDCHSDPIDQQQGSVHGKWLTGDTKVAGPTCVSCHGNVHEIAKSAGRGTEIARERARRCEVCHSDPALTSLVELKETVPLSFRDSIHGRLIAVGSERAPDCSDCHGSHAIQSKKSPASAVVGENRVKTCAKCHPAANANFAALLTHEPLHTKGWVPHFVHVMFSYLTTLTLLFFAFHVLLDFVTEIRARLAHRHDEPTAEDFQTVTRFDIHQRIQHWFMLGGVILLALTGWPLRGAGSPDAISSSRQFLALFGGAHGAAIIHRIAAGMIIISSVYHLIYLGMLAKKRVLPLSMVPNLKDAADIRDNVLFMLGLRKERPHFDRYNYLEKFDYWAVFWGIVMMVGTGFIYWFPAQFGAILPTSVLAAAHIIHGEEATLATMFLFVVHFYNVHLKPSIFPMNWAWLTGQTTVKYMKHEHPLEYEREKKK